MSLYPLLRPLLFRLDAERAHHLSLKALQLAQRTPGMLTLLRSRYAVPEDAVTVCGLTFRNRVGLAAGYDKNGIAASALVALGFGHVELGTLTRKPQQGNPQPRMHRVREAHGVINALGFPNDGVDAFVQRMCAPGARPQGAIVGINLGKGKDTPLVDATEDYCALLTQVAGLADYITINISSPNTPELRMLQTRAFIEALLRAVAHTRDAYTAESARALPVFVKIAPDLNDADLDDILLAVDAARIDGIIATNTTVRRTGLPARYADLKGGLSGVPLRALSTEIVRKLSARTGGRLPIIGVGGIDGPAAAAEKLDAGASLVQVYSGLVYVGPGLAREIGRG